MTISLALSSALFSHSSWAALAPIIWLAKAFTHLRSMTRKKICGLSTVAFCASLARSEIDSSTKTAKASNTSAETNPANAGFFIVCGLV